jgi:hypothetical protein
MGSNPLLRTPVLAVVLLLALTCVPVRFVDAALQCTNTSQSIAITDRGVMNVTDCATLGPVTVPSVEYLDLQFTNVHFATRGVLLNGNFTHSNIIFTNCTLDAPQYLISALGDIVNSTITIRNSTLSCTGDVDAVIGLYTQRAFNSSVLRVVDSTIQYVGTSANRSISMILARMDMHDSIIEMLSSRVTNNCSGVGLTCLAVHFATSTIENSVIRVADSAASVACSTCYGYNVLFQATPLRNSSFIVENSYVSVNAVQSTAYSVLFQAGSTLTQSMVSIRNSAFIASGSTAWNYYVVTTSGMFEGSQLLFENVNATATGTTSAANIVFADSPTDRSRVNVTGSSLMSYSNISLALYRFLASGLVNGSEYLVQDTTIVSSGTIAAYGALFDTSSGGSGSTMRFERCRMVVTSSSYSAGLRFNTNSGFRDGSVLTVSNSELLSRGGVYALAFAFTNNSSLTGSSMVVANSILTQIATATGYARTMELTKGSRFTDADMTWENVTAFTLCETACPARNLVLQDSLVTSSRLLFRQCRLTAVAIDSINLFANHSSLVNVTLEITDVYLNASERGVATTSNVMLQEVMLLQSRIILNRSTAVVFGSSPLNQINVGLQKVACMNSSVLVHATVMMAENPTAAATNICIYSGTNVTDGSQLSVTNTTARSLGKMHGRFFQISDSSPVDGQSSVLLRDVDAEIIVTSTGFSTAAAVLFQTLSSMVNATLDITRSRFLAIAPFDSAYGVVFYTDCSLTNGSRITISQTSMILNGTYARALTVQRSAIEFGSTLTIRGSTAVVNGDALAAGLALVSATVTDQSTILLDNTTFTVASRDVGYGVQFYGGSLQRGARLMLRGGAISVMAGTAAAVNFDSVAAVADGTTLLIQDTTWSVAANTTAAGLAMSESPISTQSSLVIRRSLVTVTSMLGEAAMITMESILGVTNQSTVSVADSNVTIAGNNAKMVRALSTPCRHGSRFELINVSATCSGNASAFAVDWSASEFFNSSHFIVDGGTFAVTAQGTASGFSFEWSPFWTLASLQMLRTTIRVTSTEIWAHGVDIASTGMSDDSALIIDSAAIIVQAAVDATSVSMAGSHLLNASVLVSASFFSAVARIAASCLLVVGRQWGSASVSVVESTMVAMSTSAWATTVSIGLPVGVQDLRLSIERCNLTAVTMEGQATTLSLAMTDGFDATVEIEACELRANATGQGVTDGMAISVQGSLTASTLRISNTTMFVDAARSTGIQLPALQSSSAAVRNISADIRSSATGRGFHLTDSCQSSSLVIGESRLWLASRNLDAVGFYTPSLLDSTIITVVRSTWLLTGSQTVAGVVLHNADFLASTLTVSQSNMSLYGGNSSYLLQQRGATTRLDQSSIMIADSTMAIIGVMNASATVFLTGNVNESSVVVQSCHITTTAATLGTLFTLQSPSTVGIMSSNITAAGVVFDCTGGSCAALSASGYAAPRPISRTAITFASVTFRTNASVSATVIDLIDSTFTDGTLVQVHDAAVRNSAAHGTATFLKGTAASVISAAASVNVTDTTVQLDGNTSALLSFDGLMNTAAAFTAARMHIGMTTTGSGHLLRGSRLIGNASVRVVDVWADCIARDEALCGVWWVAVSGEASNGTASLLRVRMSGFTTSATAMAEQALICSLECSFLNGKLLQVADGRAVCDPTTSTASSVHAECASQTGSSAISDTLSASHVSATMSGETASSSRTTPTLLPTSSLTVTSSQKTTSPSLSVGAGSYSGEAPTPSVTPSAELPLTHTQTLIVPPPPAQPVPVTVSEAIDRTATAVTTAISVLVNPAQASQASRASLVRRIAACKDDEVPPPEFAESPTRLEIGSTAHNSDLQRSIGQHAGGVLGNSLIVAAFTCAVWLLAAGKFVFLMLKNGGRTEWRRAAAWARFPAAFSVPLAFFSGPLALSGTISAVLAPPGTAAIVTTTALLVLAAPCAALLHFFVHRFRNVFVSRAGPLTNTEEGPLTTTKQLWMERLQRVMTPQVEWHEMGGGTRQLRQLGMFFAAYKDKAPWFLLVEVLWVNVAASMAAALSVVISCAAAAWITFAIYAVFVALLLWLRPYAMKLEMAGQAVVATLQTLVAALQALGLLVAAINGTSEWEDGKAAADVASICVTIASALIMLVSLADLYAFVRMQVRLWKERRESGLAAAQVALLSDLSAMERPLMAMSEEMGTVSSATLTPQPEPAGASTTKQAFLDDLLDERTLQQQQEQQQEAQQRRQAAYWEELHRNADALLRRRQDEQISGDTGSEEPAALPLWRPGGPQSAVVTNPLHRPSHAASGGMAVAAGSERDGLLATVQPTRVEDDLDALLDGGPPQHAVRDGDDLPFDLL